MKTSFCTEEAINKFACEDCLDGTCEWNCVEGATCSFRCSKCNTRMWFAGDYHEIPDRFTCHCCDYINFKK